MVDITYRTSGPNWTGKGSKLSGAEVDNNFYQLAQAIEAGVGGPGGAGIDNITQNGSQLTIHLTDGTTRGPFTLPVPAFTWRNTWQVATTYSVNDAFTDAASGSTYLVRVAHQSVEPFDPNRQVGGNLVYRKMLQGVVAPETNVTVRTNQGNFLLDITSPRRYYRIQDTAEVLVGIPDDTMLNLPVGTEIEFMQYGLFPVTMFAAPGVILFHSIDQLPSTRTQGSVLAIKKVGQNEWDVAGALKDV